jgi:transcriptional regulator with XRE-family HTH domain
MVERRKRDLTQWEVARIADIAPYRLSAFERGRLELKPDEMERLRLAFERVPVVWL